MRSLSQKAVAFSALALAAWTSTPSQAKADDVTDLFAGLVNVVIVIDNFDNLVYVNDVDILDYDYVNVLDILNEDDIAILSVLIEESPIASFNQVILDDILQFYDVLNADQIVVGVLSDQGVIYFLDTGGE